MSISVESLEHGGRISIFPSGIVVFNFAAGDEAVLAKVLSDNPGKPVVFISKKFDKTIFSQAEGRMRTFILSSKFIERKSVDPEYPAQWLDADDVIPAVPGNLSVSATDDGFLVNSLPPEPKCSASYA